MVPPLQVATSIMHPFVEAFIMLDDDDFISSTVPLPPSLVSNFLEGKKLTFFIFTFEQKHTVGNREEPKKILGRW